MARFKVHHGSLMYAQYAAQDDASLFVVIVFNPLRFT